MATSATSLLIDRSSGGSPSNTVSRGPSRSGSMSIQHRNDLEENLHFWNHSFFASLLRFHAVMPVSKVSSAVASWLRMADDIIRSAGLELLHLHEQHFLHRLAFVGPF